MKWLGRIAGGTIVLVVVVGAYLASLDVNQYKDEFIELVETATGRKFSIHGDIRLKLSFLPTLAADGITFGNAESAAHENMLTIERIEAQLALLPLLRAEIALKRLAIIGARISIETDSKGRGNWVLDPEAKPSHPDEFTALPRFDLDEVKILRTVIEYRGFGRVVREIDIRNLQLQPNGFGQPLKVLADVAFEKLQLKLVGDVSAIKRLLSNEPYAIDLSGSVGEVVMTLKGDLREPLNGKGLNLDLRLRSPQLSTLAALFDMQLSQRGPVDIKTTLMDTKKGYSLQATYVKVAESTVTGDLTFERLRKRWRIRGNIVAPQIDIADFVTNSDNDAPQNRMFSDEPQSFDWLHKIDGRVGVSIANLVSDAVVITEVSSDLKIDDGEIEINPLAAKIGDGMLDASIEMDATGETLETKLELRIVGMSLDSLPKLAQGGRVVGGSTDVTLSLDGMGNSVAAIMTGVDGILLVNTGPATINNDAAGIAGGGLVMSLFDHLNPLSSVDNTTMLECASVRFPIAHGVATNDTGIGVLTQKLGILGGGTIDLRTEELDIGAKPKPREGLGINVSSLVDFVRLGGTLTNPRVKTDAKGATTAGLKVATAGLSILAEGLFDRLTADADVCAIARGESPGAANNDQSVLESTTSKTKDALKDAGAKVKGVFKGLFGD